MEQEQRGENFRNVHLEENMLHSMELMIDEYPTKIDELEQEYHDQLRKVHLEVNARQ